MTYLEAVAAGEAAAKEGEKFLRIVPEDDSWVAVICHGVEVEVRVDAPPKPIRRLVRKEVVGTR